MLRRRVGATQDGVVGRGARLAWGCLALFVLVAPANASAGVERLTPVGAGLSVELLGSSPDGTRVILTTDAALLPADQDAKLDVYESVAGAVKLLSTGPDGGNGAYDAVARGMSKDATHVFFETKERLDAVADTDTRTDVYEHDATGTHNRTASWVGGTGGNGDTASDDAAFLKTIDDGSQLYFKTNEKLSGADTGGGTSVYRRSPNGLVSGELTYLDQISSPYSYAFALSPDGGRIVFESGTPLGNDKDAPGAMDVFALDFAGGPPSVLSAGDLEADTTFVSASFRGASRQTGRVVFDTSAPLASADGADGLDDLYEFTETGTRLLSGPEPGFTLGTPFIPSFIGISESGGTVLFDSREKLTADDDDKRNDVFINTYSTVPGLGGLRRISAGPSGGGAAIDAGGAGVSADGSHAYFETGEQLTPEDQDGGARDLYEFDGVVTRQVSTGPAGNTAPDPQGARYVGASPDGERVYFTSGARLVNEDTDASIDLYVRQAGTTTLLSLGTAGGNGAFDIQARGVSADGSHAYFRSTEGLTDANPGGWNLYATGAPAITPTTPGTPPPPPAAAGPRDTIKPKLSFALVKGQKLKSVLKRRAIALRLGCDEPCKLVAALSLGGAATAARKAVRLGSGSTRLTAAGSRVVIVKLTKPGRAALAKTRRSARVTVAVTATDAAGNTAARTARLTMRR